MSKFLTKLTVEQIEEDQWQLTAPLAYDSDLIDETIVVPQGFVTDFASVPRLPLAYMVTGGKAHAAAVIHDWLYSTQTFQRSIADDIFREAIVAAGHSRFTAFLMWAGVRLGGGFAWDKPNVPQPPHIELN